MDFLNYKGSDCDIYKIKELINTHVDNLKNLNFEEKWEIDEKYFKING